MGMTFDWDAEAAIDDGSGCGSDGGYSDGGYSDGDYSDDDYSYGGYGSYGYGDGYGYGYCGGGYGELADSFCCAIAAQYYVSDGVVALWRSDENGYPANNGSLGTPAKAGGIVTSSGPLELCGAGTLHATWHPSKWRGERLWVVALHGDVVIGEDKLGALKREYLAEITFG
jgi:hypothetical protein